MTIAGAGLYTNPPGDVGVALTANVNLTSAVSSYLNQPVVDKFVSVIELANTVIGTGPANITSSTYNTLFTISSSNFPALTDVPSTGNVAADLIPNGLTYNSQLITDIVNFNSVQILGNGDLSKFCQAFQSAQGYRSQANGLLNSVQSSAVLATTFDPATGGMDSLSTGCLNQVTNNLARTSSDFALLGNLIDLANLDDLGLPGELLAQIGRVAGGTSAAVSDLLQAVSIPAEKIRSLNRGTNNLTSTEERAAYTAMLAVTGATLEQILLVLRVRTANISNMAQLLDPRQLLPNSYLNLLCPSVTGLDPVYLPNGSVNSNLRTVLLNPDVTLYSGPNNTNGLVTLEKIIPADAALANKALARSLSQIKSITNSNLPAISAAMAAVQTSGDLGDVSSLTTPIPTSVKDFYQSQLAEGSGPNGQILLTDLIGTPSGIGITSELETVTVVIGNLATATANLVSCYDNMLGVLGNVYGDSPTVIPSGPGAGTYTDYNDAFVTGLIPAANTLVSTITSTQTSEVTLANSAWANVIAGLSRQQNNQVTAELNFSELVPNNKTSVMSFTTNLHGYGLDVEPGDANQYLAAVANLSSLSGQSVIASLREGRNIKSLQTAGLGVDTQLNDR
jgi:hypothetical protein